MSNKMQWTQPQLIVLARGTAEEAVLAVCKQQPREYENPGAGPFSINQTYCNKGEENDGKVTCGACQGVTGS